MSRNVPPALLAHLQQSVTTTCRLLRITLNDGRVFGMTTLDREVEYLGVTYSAVNGFDPSITATDTGLSVDNAEAYALLSADVPGITVEMVAAGELDDAQWFTREQAKASLDDPESHPDLRMPGPMAIAHKLVQAWVAL